MGERSRNREIVERLAARVKEHHAQRGERITSEAAHRQVADMARVRDQQRAEGLHKNKKKGEASSKRAEAKAREQIDRAKSERRTGRITIDLGKKG